MKKEKKFAYFYNRENKTESIGVVASTHNYGRTQSNIEKAARKYLPQCVEEFSVLEVVRQGPFGSMVSYALSIDFDEIMNFFKTHTLNPEEKFNRSDLEHIPEDIPLLAAFGEPMSWKEIIKDIKVLYMMRRYVEMCADHPSLYSIGQLYRFLGTVYKQGWYPRTLGLFAPIDISPVSQHLFSDRELYEVQYCRDLDTNACNLSALDGDLRYNLLGWGKGDYLPNPVIEVTEFSGFVEAALLSLFYLIQERIPIKKCANCGKFFIPLTRSDAIYCDRLSPQDNAKTCKEYGSKVLWYENVISDDVARLARNIYCSKQMLAKRNPDKSEYADMFAFFKAEKKEWEKEVKNGTKTREEYAEWLRKMKLCKTKAELEES